jgi:hypothetical protein
MRRRPCAPNSTDCRSGPMTAPSLQRSVGSGASGGRRWHSDFCEKPVLIHAMAPRHRCSHHRIRRKVELAPNHPRIICTIRPIGLGQERCSLLISRTRRSPTGSPRAAGPNARREVKEKGRGFHRAQLRKPCPMGLAGRQSRLLAADQGVSAFVSASFTPWVSFNLHSLHGSG